MPFTLAPLPFATGALEPTIDKATMEVHYNGHHKAYVDNLNKALEASADLLNKPVAELLANNLAIVPAAVKTAVQNNGGGHYNHTMFWEILNPANRAAQPIGSLATAINSSFSSFDNFKTQFKDAALKRFGSGWAWLVKSGPKLEIISTANQDCPVMTGHFPVLGLDVWEHAYYLKHQNKRAAYIDGWWNVLNWNVAEERFKRGS
jgi:Fe-Mn family superoxide dismutase